MKYALIMLVVLSNLLRADIVGPYVNQYANFELWNNYDPVTGNYLETWDYSYIKGETPHLCRQYQYNEAWNERYGLTSYGEDYYWPTDGAAPYMIVCGWQFGAYVYEIRANCMLQPDAIYLRWNEDQTFDLGMDCYQIYYRSAFCILAVNANNVNQGSKPDQLIPLSFGAQYYLYDDIYDDWYEAGPVPYDQLTSSGNTINCNGIMYIYKSVNGYAASDVTPVATAQYTNYTFQCSNINVTKQHRTVSNHPLLNDKKTPEQVQMMFNNASIDVLAVDNDVCVPGQVIPFVVSVKDDFQKFAEFYITPADNAEFPSEWAGNEFNEIFSEPNMRILHNATFSNIKLVKHLPNPYIGWADVTGNKMLFGVQGLNNKTVLMHEWLHNKGITHRGTPDNPDKNGRIDNEGTTDDTEAVMHHEAGTYAGKEVNRYE